MFYAVTLISLCSHLFLSPCYDRGVVCSVTAEDATINCRETYIFVCLYEVKTKYEFCVFDNLHIVSY